jgi:hypothetical protein
MKTDEIVQAPPPMSVQEKKLEDEILVPPCRESAIIEIIPSPPSLDEKLEPQIGTLEPQQELNENYSHMVKTGDEVTAEELPPPLSPELCMNSFHFYYLVTHSTIAAHSQTQSQEVYSMEKIPQGEDLIQGLSDLFFSQRRYFLFSIIYRENEEKKKN